ncbi:hypothetical protein M378DRAFT_820014 [Amanita muscaria Koide BX008]|uniref:Uncharacterized protein n=1 Tax=Amanita muscaria (strain Koide BX008) TaxID=946122 RepID=A0A0C2T591_AMAMK|nr:hypothetical protein M378DRAFT_820014 [Amanita muscaria Koide BX008]
MRYNQRPPIFPPSISRSSFSRLLRSLFPRRKNNCSKADEDPASDGECHTAILVNLKTDWMLLEFPRINAWTGFINLSWRKFSQHQSLPRRPKNGNSPILQSTVHDRAAKSQNEVKRRRWEDYKNSLLNVGQVTCERWSRPSSSLPSQITMRSQSEWEKNIGSLSESLPAA